MQRYKQNPWVFIVIGIMAIFGVLFGAGVWYMIAVGFSQALGFWGSTILALVAAPGVAIGSVVMFAWGEHIKKFVLDWEHQYGKIEKLDREGHIIGYEEGWRSSVKWVFIIKFAIFLLDSAGIWYRVLTLDTSIAGKVLLIIVFEILAFLPWPLGTLVYRVIYRPAGAIRRDIYDLIAINEAHNDLRMASQAMQKPASLPPHMRPTLPAPDQKVFISAHVDRSSTSSDNQ